MLWALLLTGGTMAFELHSPAFYNGGMIPSKYTCDGSDISPPLIWGKLPSEAKSLVVIMEDPDAPAGTWDHWMLFNISPNIHGLPENINKNLPLGAKFGKNSWKRNDYGGPCPPNGMHRYFFKLYTLNTILELNEGVDKVTLQNAMKKHIIASAQLIGKYQRS